MQPSPAQISDDVILAVVCQLGAPAEARDVRRALNLQLHAEIDEHYLEERLRRLQQAGLVDFFQRRATNQWLVHLTAAGVERLQSLQREPVTPATK